MVDRRLAGHERFRHRLVVPVAVTGTNESANVLRHCRARSDPGNSPLPHVVARTEAVIDTATPLFVDRHRSGNLSEVVERPVVAGIIQAGFVELGPVVVDAPSRAVLWKGQDVAVVAEGFEERGDIGILADAVPLHVRTQIVERPPRPIVLDDAHVLVDHVRGRAASEQGGQAGHVVFPGFETQLDGKVGLRLLEFIDERLVELAFEPKRPRRDHANRHLRADDRRCKKCRRRCEAKSGRARGSLHQAPARNGR